MQNNKRYWLRGGIVGPCIAITIILLLYLPSGITYEPKGLLILISVLFMFTHTLLAALYGCDVWYALDTQNLTKCPDYLDDVALILFIISSILTSMLIGSILGWIYGKIRNKNRV